MNRRDFTLGAAALALAACGSAPPVPRDVFYRLGPFASQGPLAGGPITGTVEVPSFRAEGVINERAILYREGPRALSQYSYHTWSESPSVMMQQAFIGALRQSQAFTTIASPDMRLDRDYELTGTIRQLEHVIAGANGMATIEIDLALRRVRDNQQLLAKTYHGEEAAPVDNIEATVGAFTKAMDSICASFLRDLATVPKTAPAT